MWKQAEEFLASDKYLGSFVKRYGSPSLKKRPKSKYFISLVRAITNQQLSVKAASTIFSRVEKKVGVIDPENILKRRDITLRNCGLSNAKVSYVKDLARKVKDNEVEIHKMDKLTNEKIMKELVAVHGIGRWSAEMFLMFTLGSPDIFPVDDLALRKGVKKLVKKEMTNEEIENFAMRWAPWRTIASWYIWRSLES